jgi:uncharacterized protein
MTIHLELSPQKIAQYRAHSQQRQQAEQAVLQARRQQAWQIARHAATLLRHQFGATKIMLFGSLAREHTFNQWSDIDIAAWGIAPQDTFRAIGVIMDLDTDIPVTLVDVNTALPSLLAAIERDGIEL